jgi:hypothetical protein
MGVGGQRHASAALPPRNTRHPLCRRVGGLQGRSVAVRTQIRSFGLLVWTVMKIRCVQCTQLNNRILSPSPPPNIPEDGDTASLRNVVFLFRPVYFATFRRQVQSPSSGALVLKHYSAWWSFYTTDVQSFLTKGHTRYCDLVLGSNV